jgi:hypothetical protein
MPRYEADTDLETVKANIAEHCIDDVCAVDNKAQIKRRFFERTRLGAGLLFVRRGRKIEIPRGGRIRHRRFDRRARKNVSGASQGRFCVKFTQSKIRKTRKKSFLFASFLFSALFFVSKID